ncbi:MAG: LamG domain-containing protein, partial [Actinomycetia bacterium]|nr:LamG domain-containing protein [Actinomycetes bacterium]
TVTALTSATIPDSGVRRSNFSGAGGLDPTSPAAGAAGVALDVNGGSERAVGPGLDIVATELSFSAWVRLDSSGAQHAVISKQDQAGNPIYELAVDGTTGEATATVRLSGANPSARGGTVGVAAWHHLAALWDGTDLILMVDGLEVDRVAAVGVLATDVATRTVIGNRADTSRPLNGRIDYVEINHSAPVLNRVTT